MEILIRPIRIEDAVAINEIRRMDGVMENTLGLKSDRIVKSEDFIKGLGGNAHILVAEIDEDNQKKVVGLCGLHLEMSPRMRHSGSVGISVSKDYQGMGVGSKLMEAILDIADNWLMLVRVELSVFTDNEAAMALYKKMGFEIEGRKKFAVIRNGKYIDEYIMGRYHLISIE
jgi:L-phenylalanine/L-methionine N-acetyltransferase